MKILVACEYSGTVRDAFAAKGHDAWSCDLLPTDSPGQHLIMDNDMHLKDTLYEQHWDMVIGHPPCTRLTNSVIWYIKKHNLYHEVEQAAIFFNMILNCPAKYICVENPIQHNIAKQYIRKQDQIIQPYEFGEDASKATCLWLKNLPLLKPTDYYPARIVNGKKRWGNQTDGGWNKLGPSPTRGHERSKTYEGIAKAMADQWSNVIPEPTLFG